MTTVGSETGNSGALQGGALFAAWRALEEGGPRPGRPRDSAAQLGVSEAALVACRCGQDGTIRLNPDPRGLLAAAPALGLVKTITRNDWCVHEKVGRFEHISFHGAMGLVVNHDIDLRLFLGHWRHAFAVPSIGADRKLRHSLQFFDADGTAVHKIFLTESADAAAYDRLCQEFAHHDQSGGFEALALPEPAADRPDSAIDVAGLERHWRALQDTHDFFAMLRAFGVGRAQAMRLMPADLVEPVGPDTVAAVLEGAASDGVPIMVFVGNRGCIQIHTGTVHTVKTMGPWLNVLDPTFDLHLRTDAVARAYVVRKPTIDGTVTALELFTADGTCFVQMFGERKPGQPERADWQALLARCAPAAGHA
jgi:putative hemin transport protein